MKSITRSKTNRKVAGVIGGLANYTKMDSTILRVLFIILLFVTGFFPLLIAYGLLVFVLPNEGE
ncbi:PspC domain-containing protein [Mangrovibacillus cuniculi]|uniref:PspC domain-containing protein n=1 Tax=Mangrovibacillus cuniculi TaxID=2593652 RepID=A0A7S8CCI9_9BACI|nr:PspC domain-containing protein [Mangrovibacillus cuniculi]QPC47469.1 PspC domain-containing protein [Mangrovibacillus cuniculi]